ncbi:MAG: hypothetical protein ABIH50_06530, partial [bacterium]
MARGLENEIIKRVGAVGLKVDGRRDV